MWKFKNHTPASDVRSRGVMLVNRLRGSHKTAVTLSESSLRRTAVKRIIAVLTAGVLLLLFDAFVGFDFADLPLQKGDQGVYLVRPAEGGGAGHVTLKADIETEEGTVTKEYDLSLDPYSRDASGISSGSGNGDPEKAGTAMSEEELVAYEMRSVIGSLNDDQSLRRVTLPDHLRTGEKIRWEKVRKTNTVMITFGMMLLAAVIYTRRLDPLVKIRKAQRSSVHRQLPEFVNRLVLLLGAGLVLSAAFERIVEEALETESLRGDFFYGSMAEIYHKVKETNGSMAKEIGAFARTQSGSWDGSRDLLRISNILTDNISKGVELTDKLRTESESLWLARKRDSEERGRLAETKLTLPLTVFLLVLVVVTVSPALLEL